MQEVINKLCSGQRIYVAGSSNEPTGLLRDLAASDLPENLEFIQFPLRVKPNRLHAIQRYRFGDYVLYVIGAGGRRC